MAEPSPSLTLIGPMPPPVGGATRTFAEFVDAAGARGEAVRVVDTSPGSVSRLLEPQYRIVAAARLVRALRHRGRTGPVVWFASVGMLLRLSRLVPSAASRGQLSIVCFGGRLGEELLALQPTRRAVVVGNLAAARRVWVETRRAADEAIAAGLTNVAVLGPTRGMHGVRARTDHVPIAGRPLRLVSVGRVCRDKGVADAVALVDAADGAVVLDVAGPVDPEFAGAFAALESHDGVTYHGELEPTEVRRLLRDADASVVLSDYVGEGLPGAAIESLLVGTPVIVSRHRGLPELVRDGVDGFVVDRDPSGSWDITSLRHRLSAIDDAAWRQMRVEAATIEGRCDPVAQCERIVGELASPEPRTDGTVAPPARLVYVMGRGHSGSTLLDSVLASADGVEGVGELVVGMLRPHEPCSCGESIGDCPFWRSVRDEAERVSGVSWQELGEETMRQAMVKRFPHELRTRFDQVAACRRDLLLAPVRAISAVSGAATVVDSSKEITRALFLSRFVPRTHLVHLVRDPVDVAASDIHRARNGSFRFQRRQLPTGGLQLPFLVLSTVGWLVGNTLAEVVTRRGRAGVTRVRYEDLCRDPAATLALVGIDAGIDVTSGVARVAAGEPIDFGHKIGGNAIRTQGPVRVEAPAARRRSIRRDQVVLVRLLTAPLRRRYGY